MKYVAKSLTSNLIHNYNKWFYDEFSVVLSLQF